MTATRAALGAPAASRSFLLLVGAVLPALALTRLLPEQGVGLSLRLAAATLCVFVLPGAAIVRALGRPASLALAASGSFVWSLAALFPALALTFLVGGSLALTLGLLGAITGFALLAAVARPPRPVERSDLLACAAVLAGGTALGALVWWVMGPVAHDAPFHLARTRKLLDLPDLDSLRAVSEFADGDLHPGYAMPLWHAALALVAMLAGVDPAAVVRHVQSWLTPVALLCAYATGQALFRSWAAGVAAAAGVVALETFPPEAVWSLRMLSDPESASRMLVLPALLAFAFAFTGGGSRAALATVAAASFVLAVIHPTYVPYVLLLLAGFLAARLLLRRDDRSDAARIAVVAAAAAGAAGPFLAWLVASVDRNPLLPAGVAMRDYSAYLAGSGGALHVDPRAITAFGAAAAAALLAVPAAGLAGRRLWAAFVLGTSLVLLAFMLAPPLFGLMQDALSLGQARRLPWFLPFALALTGAAVLLGRFRWWGAAVAAGAGGALYAAYPGGPVSAGGPAWPVVVAGAGGAAALVLAAVFPRAGPQADGWTALAGAAFLLPLAAGAFSSPAREPGDPRALSPQLVATLQEETSPGDVVFASPDAAYRVGAFAPVYVNVGPVGHVALTRANRVGERLEDARRFFRRGTTPAARAALLAEYGADWVVVGATTAPALAGTPGLIRVYSDGRRVLYRRSAP